MPGCNLTRLAETGLVPGSVAPDFKLVRAESIVSVVVLNVHRCGHNDKRPSPMMSSILLWQALFTRHYNERQGGSAEGPLPHEEFESSEYTFVCKTARGCRRRVKYRAASETPSRYWVVIY